MAHRWELLHIPRHVLILNLQLFTFPGNVPARPRLIFAGPGFGLQRRGGIDYTVYHLEVTSCFDTVSCKAIRQCILNGALTWEKESVLCRSRKKMIPALVKNTAIVLPHEDTLQDKGRGRSGKVKR